MKLLKILLTGTTATLFALQTATAQTASADGDAQLQNALRQIQALVNQVAAQDARIRDLEAARTGLQVVATIAKPEARVETSNSPTPPIGAAALVPEAQSGASADSDIHDHMINLPGGGPALKIRGFFDVNFGLGTDSNPLIFPLPPAGRNTFQLGEFDLFMSSKLSDKLSFVSEVVLGSDQTNTWGLDVERAQLTYKFSRYFEISGGRYHTSIGYYSTAFHHGTWFQTATGRPFMYFFEDSGGILPVHGVGATMTGLVPGSGSLGWHWVAEVSNGRGVDPGVVQNFASNKTAKAYNFATYIKPSWAPGLQIGGSIYTDRVYPPELYPTRINERISSAYVVYNNSVWEFMTEGVLLTNTVNGTGQSYNSPLFYGQISRKFGSIRPYVRYQYVNSVEGDPVNQYIGRYDGPSIGVRKDVSDYVALKLQYNLLHQRLLPNANGLLAQMAFTF